MAVYSTQEGWDLAQADQTLEGSFSAGCISKPILQVNFHFQRLNFKFCRDLEEWHAFAQLPRHILQFRIVSQMFRE